MLDGSEIDSLLILGAVQVVGEVVGLLLGMPLVTAVLARLGYRASPGAGAVRSPVSIGDSVGFVILAVGVVVGEHLALGPHELITNFDVRVSSVVGIRLATKAKELRTCGAVALGLDLILSSKVEIVLMGIHIGVVNGQRLFEVATE